MKKLCAVPHGSGNTKQVSDLCAGFAKELGLAFRQDEHNNLVIWKEASPGYEDAPPVILQGHMDMVCAKTGDCPKDMAREGLDLATDGEWVWAEQTSLGGDNGVAVATDPGHTWRTGAVPIRPWRRCSPPTRRSAWWGPSPWTAPT